MGFANYSPRGLRRAARPPVGVTVPVFLPGGHLLRILALGCNWFANLALDQISNAAAFIR